MEFISVKNWEKFQHYKDRNPPWIKLHRDLLRDYDFSCLQDADKLLLMLLWLLASQLGNRIPNDPEWIRQQIGVKDIPSIKPLIDQGFIYIDSMTLAECKQSAVGETETEAYKEETEEEETSQQQKLRDVIFEKKDSLIRLSNVTAGNFEITAEQCIAHYRAKRIDINPYATALGWFKNERKSPDAENVGWIDISTLGAEQ